MNRIKDRVTRLFSRIEELASISESPGSIDRVFGTPAAREGAIRVLEWMREAGLESRIDAIGNVRGILRTGRADAKTFVIGSHIDTVRNAGRFDGTLGVLAGLDLVEQLIRSKRSLPFNLELIAFSDEEGVRFQTTYLGSKVVAGSFDPSTLRRRDEGGATLQEVIDGMGGNSIALQDEAIAPGHWLGYFELHIEQGPVLYDRKIPVSLVSAIAGQVRAEIIFRGEAGHAGTVPMDMRTDALCAAAEFILDVERSALASKGKWLATIGKLHVRNAAGNVIPGEVVCSLDLRSAVEAHLWAAYEAIREQVAAITGRRHMTLEWNLLMESKPVPCDAGMNALLSEAIMETGYEPLELISGAGHDAVPISVVSPVCMLFVRCFKGISHHPLEHVELEDLAAAIAVAEKFMDKVIESY